MFVVVVVVGCSLLLVVVCCCLRLFVVVDGVSASVVGVSLLFVPLQVRLGVSERVRAIE